VVSGKNRNGNRFLSWEWVGMGMGMVYGNGREWEQKQSFPHTSNVNFRLLDHALAGRPAYARLPLHTRHRRTAA